MVSNSTGCRLLPGSSACGCFTWGRFGVCLSQVASVERFASTVHARRSMRNPCESKTDISAN